MSITHKILVPTDFSSPAKNALDYAAVLAKHSNAELHLIHVFHIPVIDPYMPGDTTEAMIEETKKAATLQMETLKSGLSDLNVFIDIKLGFVIDDVVDYCEEHKIDLIVMGTTGASGLKEIFFGSVASGIIEKSKVKVIAVPDEYAQNSLPKTMVYAADFTDNEEVILTSLCLLAKEWDAHLTVLHVASDEPVFTAAAPNVLFEELMQNINYKKADFAEITDNDVVEAIIKFVSDSGSDMLCMAMHKRNLFEKMFHKSKTKSVAHQIEIPLLSLHKQ